MKVFFGGPDQPARALRDLLEARVDAVPTGGTIDWMTYYFRDEPLAEALVRAHARGVQVRVAVEGYPRRRQANDRVIEILKRGIHGGLRVERRLFGASHLHTKLYAFSDPIPHALVGSFNPSGTVPEHDPELIADIGDQDRGHNLLVEIDEPRMVDTLIDAARGDLRERTVRDASAEADFFPRADDPLRNRIRRFGKGSKLRIAASHLRDPTMARELAVVVERGGSVEVLTHHTQRRSPEKLVEKLRSAGVRTYRYEHPAHLPMHAKFVVAEDAGSRWSAFGSYNLSRTSRWLNQELLMFSEDSAVWKALDARWMTILAEPWCTQ
jgi:hypothetical protein